MHAQRAHADARAPPNRCHHHYYRHCRALKLEQDRAITDLRIEFERDTRELQMVYEDRMVRGRCGMRHAG